MPKRLTGRLAPVLLPLLLLLLIPAGAAGQHRGLPQYPGAPRQVENPAGFAQNPAPAAPPGKLGRASPKAQYDIGHFRAVVGQDGKTRYFPRVAKHRDASRAAAPVPASVDWSVKAPNVVKRMYANDQLGDCVWASRYHRIGFHTGSDAGAGLEATDAEVVATYHAACGRGDNGCDMSAVNQYEQTHGAPVAGKIHKTDGAVAVDHTQQELTKVCIVVFGGLSVGMNLPNAWYSSPDGADWGPTNSAVVGGHEVQAFGFDDKGVWIATWGGKRRILWAAWLSTRWIDEVYATLSPDWYGSDQMAPNGIDAQTLKADLAAVANGQVPPLPGPVPPGPPNPPTPPTPPAPTAGFSGTLVFEAGVLKQVTPGGTGWDVAGGTAADRGDALEALKPLVIRHLIRQKGMTRAEAKAEVDKRAAGGLGPFVQWVLANLPGILKFVEEILTLFGITVPPLPPLPVPPPPAPAGDTPAGCCGWRARAEPVLAA